MAASMASGGEVIESLQQYRSALHFLNQAKQTSSACELANLGEELAVEKVASSNSVGQSSSASAGGNTSNSDLSGLPFISAEELDTLPNFPASFPSVKRIPGTQFVVDGFRNSGPWSVSYFLSHFHSDHYTGLTNLWTKGLVFCSEITAHLVRDSLQVPNELVVSLSMGKAHLIDGCEVTLVDANHCPGAVQFLFRVPDKNGGWQRYVHCGDMRFSPAMKSEASLCDFVGADAVFLDTTYCNPRYVFPSQQTSVEYVAETVHRLMEQDKHGVVVEEAPPPEVDTIVDGGDGSDEEDDGPERCHEGDVTNDSVEESFKIVSNNVEEDDPDYDRRDGKEGVSNFKPVKGMSTLFLISTYVIGKEKILTAVARRCNCLIYVTEKKLTILKRLDIEDINVFTTDPAATNVHVVKWSFLGETWPYFRPNFVNMEKAMLEIGYQKVVGFVPTGWTYELKKKTFSVRKKGPFEIHLVPYSEHSNYEELREYVGFLRPKEIIPTVGLEGGGMESKAVAAMRKHFRNLVDETASKRNFLKGFSRKPAEELTTFVTPKAVFGRLSRKRTRETDEEFTEGYPEASLLPPAYQQSLKESKDVNMSAVSRGLLRGEQGKDLIEDMETDISAMELNEDFLEDVSKSKMEAGVNKNEDVGHSPIKKPAVQEISTPVKVVNSQVRLSQAVNVSSSQRSSAVASKRPQSSKIKSRVPKKTASTVKRKPKSASSPLPFKKVSTQSPSSGATQFSRNQKALQSSILNFFKKPAENLDSTQNVPTENVKRELNFSGNSALLKNVGLEPSSVGGGNVSNMESVEVQVDTNKWADEYEQLASILDGNISKEQAHFFLEKAGGNVGIALDLFYTDQHEGDSNGQPNALVKPPIVSTTQGQSEGNSGVVISHDSIAEASSQEEVHEPVAPQVQLESVKWAHEYEQLASILEGNVSKEEAYLLLEKAWGDVTIAVDLFYTKQSVKEVNLPLNTAKKLHQTGGELLTDITCQVSTRAGLKDEVKSPPSKEDKAHKVSSPVPGPRSSLFSHSKKKSDGPGENNLLDKKTMSVAVPAAKYSPIEHACWKTGEPAPYLHLARAFDLIEQESGRLKTADMLCNMFRSLLALSPEAVLPAVYLTTIRIVPDFESGELSIGGSLVSSAITEIAGVSRPKLREMYITMGDLGDVAQACRQTQSSLRLPPPLGICQVFSTLKQISKEAGTGSGARKKELVLSLLRACREKEMKYMVRTLIQNMRIGAMMKTVLSALAQAVVLHRTFSAGVAPDRELAKLKPKLQEASAAVVEAYNFLPNLDLMVPTLIKDGVEALSASFTMSPGTPIKPMLAKITNGVPEVLKRFQGQLFTCEYKYDGQRAQIHMLLDGTIRIFTRDSGEATGRFPDVINIVKEAASEDLKSFIIDAEVVAIDRENDNKLLAFQHLSTRERGSKDGSSVNLQNIKVHVAVFVFDMMFANNDSLAKLSLQARRRCLQKWFPNIKPGYFEYASEITVEADEDPVTVGQKIQGYLEEAFAASCEGLMAKALVEDSSYMASKRSDSWLKIKRDYVEGLQDSLDLVPIGAWYGNGRKAGWYSPFLLACYDPEREEYQSVCRVMSGFTDVFYKEMTEFYSGDRVLPQKPPYYRTGEECSVWFTPELVWEILGADFTVSPVHQAAVGLIHPSRGISMRFPRFIKSRPDKKPEDANGPSDIADLFHKQTRKLDVPGSSARVTAKQDSPD
ncbi:unnamed protein product [Calypogeia fissa]